MYISLTGRMVLRAKQTAEDVQVIRGRKWHPFSQGLAPRVREVAFKLSRLIVLATRDISRSDVCSHIIIRRAQPSICVSGVGARIKTHHASDRFTMVQRTLDSTTKGKLEEIITRFLWACLT